MDAGHAYELVRSDSEKALEMVRPGGVILWHDYHYTHDGVYTLSQRAGPVGAAEVRAEHDPGLPRRAARGAARGAGGPQFGGGGQMSRVAFISAVENYFWGGSEELWSQVALRMAQQGVTVGANVTHNARTPEPLRALIDAGGAVTWRPDAGAGSLLGRASRHFQPDKIYRWLDSFRPDFAFISQGTNLDGYKWMRECARRKIPFVTVAQSASEVAWPHSEMATEIAEGYEAARACFFVSRSNMELTRRQLARPLPNAQVVRNPFNVSYDAAPRWPASEPVWKLACVGRLEPNSKGQDILFEVLQDERGANAPLK